MHTRYIFLVGTGRSGTHLIGRTIGSHPEIDARIEAPWTFRLVTQIAAGQDWKNAFAISWRKSILFIVYKLVALLCRQPFILEKSHPSLWIVEDLAERFPGSKFIAVWREVEPTVASMLKHKGIRRWYEILPLDKENRFLGITAGNRSDFLQMGMEARCALRWRSHTDEIDRLAALMPGRLMKIKYDEFLDGQEKFLGDLAEFIGIPNQFSVEQINMESLSKWKLQLSTKQLELIRQAVGPA